MRLQRVALCRSSTCATNASWPCSGRLGTALNAVIERLFENAGIPLHIALETTEMASVLGLVSAGAGIAIVPASVVRHRSRYVVLRPLTDRGAEVELFQLLSSQSVPTAQNLRALLAAQMTNASASE